MKSHLVVVGVVLLIAVHLLALHASGLLLRWSPAVAVPIVALAIAKHVGVFALLRKRLRSRPALPPGP